MLEPKEVRRGSGGLAVIAALVLFGLLTTTPPPGRYYPGWAFLLAGLAIALGLAGVVSSFFMSERKTSEQEVLERILAAVEESNELTKRQLEQRTQLAPEVIESGVTALEAKGKVEVSGDDVKWIGSYADGYG